jgi:hypothetical protein
MLKRITLSEVATDQIVSAAIRGYKSRYKKERLGILLGRVSRGVALVEQTVVYYGGPGTRKSAFVDLCNFQRRINILREESGLDFLGSFHTHVEVNNSISSVPSPTDKIPLCDDPPSFIEIIATIWASDASVQPANCYLQGDAAGIVIAWLGMTIGRVFASCWSFPRPLKTALS